MDGRSILTSVGVTARKIVLHRHLPVEFDITLIGIHEGRDGVELVEAHAVVHGQRIQVRAGEQILYRRTEETQRNLVVGKRSPVAAGVQMEWVIELDGAVGRVEHAREVAFAEIRGEHGVTVGGGWGIFSQSLIVGEEEQLVLDDGSAEGAPELVPAQWRARDLRIIVPVIAPVIGVELVVA